MIRVLYTINNLDTAGLKYVVANLIRRHNRERVDPLLAVGRKTGTLLEQEVAQYCPVEEINLHVPRQPRLSFPGALISTSRRLRGLADIAISFDYSSDWTEGLAMRLAGVPWIFFKTNMNWDARKWWLRCASAVRIVCQSQEQTRLLSGWERKLSLIPLGIDIDQFQNAQALSRQEYGLTGDDLVLVSLAQLVPVKGHAELLKAMRHVHNDLPNLRLILLGTGYDAYCQELRKLAFDLGIEQKVIFWGYADNVPQVLKMCDGKILATRNTGRRDAFPSAVIEAMAAGLPVIATRCGGPEEMIIDGKTGWLVDAKGWEPLAESMRLFYADASRRRALGDAGQQRARELYCVDLMVERYEALYETVVA
jgi:glycosyltransferase involved in cell wall biosynthesis